MNKIKAFKKRHLTVSTGQRFLSGSRHPEPRLRLMGKWLQDAGFSPGDRITITVKSGKLEIRKDNHN